VSDEPKPEAEVTREEFLALRRELEARLQDFERRLAEARERIRVLECRRQDGQGGAVAVVGMPSGYLDFVRSGAWHAAGAVRRRTSGLGLGRRLRALRAWCRHVWRAMREGPAHA
jgi:hypothetical protein